MSKKTTLTTTDIAVICDVAPRTVTKWYENGLLKGHKLPGSKHRRFQPKDLIDFMQKQEMPEQMIEKVRQLGELVEA